MIPAGDPQPMTPAGIRGRLEASTPVPVALVTSTPVTVASWLVDAYGSRSGWLVLTKSDGTRVRRQLIIRHNGTDAADATAAEISATGSGVSADFDASTDWIAAAFTGAGTEQTLDLQVTAAANGSSWTVTFAPDFDKVS